MKKSLVLLFCIGLSSFIQGQSYSIEGLIKSDDNEGMPFTTIVLYSSADSSLIKAGLSDENGGFKISGVKSANYYIDIELLGFQKFRSTNIDLKNKDLVLAPFILKAQTQLLSEVVIKSSKPIIEVLADKTVFNVQGTISAAGTSAFELLRKAPGVIIDNNDNLIVEGKSGVQIYIDGKPSILSGQDLVAYLKTLQASDIDAVEIITQPSSRYDGRQCWYCKYTIEKR